MKIFQIEVQDFQEESGRLALARALYKNPKILIMDEPTSSLG